MEINNLKDFSNISFKGAEQTTETSYFIFARILSMKMNQKNQNAAWKNKLRSERTLTVTFHVR